MKKSYIPSIVILVVSAFILGLLTGRKLPATQEQAIVPKPTQTTVAETTSTTTSSTTTTTIQAWNPEGYVVVLPQDGVATRWLENGEFSCGYYDWCWGMEVITKFGCSNLYVEISLKNKNGVNIGWTNDTAQGLAPGDKAQLIFGTYDSQAETASLAEVSCY